TDHARITLRDVRVPDGTVFGGEGRGLQVVQHFFNENRIRQAASSLGAAQYCVNESVGYAIGRKPFGKPLAANQAIQLPRVARQTVAGGLGARSHNPPGRGTPGAPFPAPDKVAVSTSGATGLSGGAAAGAMRVPAGRGSPSPNPFEHISRPHRRYRITEG